MVTEDFVSFFAVSAGASATLIGLLFIAISIEPARVFGSEARAEAAAKASSAFTALANVFFVSLAALIPHIGVGIPVLVMSAFALINTVQTGRDLWSAEERRARGGWALVLGGFVVYGLELRLGWALFRNSAGMANEGYLDGLAFLILGIYGIALWREAGSCLAPLQGGDCWGGCFSNERGANKKRFIPSRTMPSGPT
jgi:hypothetical protein